MLRASLVALLSLLLVGAARADENAPPAQLTKAPRLLHFVPAAAPATLEAHGGRVAVILTIDIDETGKVVNVAVARPSPFPQEGYEDAAIDAARQFQFSPGEAAGKPVPVRITYEYVFVMKPPVAPASRPPGAPSSEGPAGTPEPLAPSPGPAAAPATVPVDGQLRQKGERTPLPSVTVVVGDDATSTDFDGRFHFDLPPGDYLAKVRGGNVIAADVPFSVHAGTKLSLTWYVTVKERYSSIVRGQKVVQETVEQTLSGDELRHIPGTQGDTLKAVQNLPGVARAPFGSGQIVVWGSAPEDTRSYVDGVYIPTLYHFFGLRSTVASEMVDSLSFSPGGYGVDHGRGLGGVIEIETRKPTDNGFHGFVQLDLIDASLLLEAKLTKTLSIAVAARRSTIDAWLPHIPLNNFQLTPTYYDYQLKLSWRPTPRDDLELFLFGADDQIDLALARPDPALSAEFSSHIFYHRLLAKYQHRWGKATFTLTPWIGYDVPIEVQGNFGNTTLTIDATNVVYGLRAVARVPLTSFLRVDAGLDFEGARYDINASGPSGGMPREGDAPGSNGRGGIATDAVTSYTNLTAPYVSLPFILAGKKLTITPGLRLDIYSLAGYLGTPNQYSKAYVNWEPRLQVRYQLRPWVAIKAALGVYHQPPDQSALTVSFGNPNVVPQLSMHYVLGADFDPYRTLHVEVEGFYKDLRDLIVRGQAGEPILDNDGIGRVYGMELLIRQELWKGLFGWVSYTLSRAERQDHPDEPWHLFQYDQTHILTLVASYKLPRGYQVGIRFRYVTGNPITPDIGGWYDGNSGSYHPIPSPVLYSARAGDFNQLDIRFDKYWTFNRWKLLLYLDIQNVYNYRSEEGRTYNYNFTQYQPITGLPFVPDLGLRGEW